MTNDVVNSQSDPTKINIGNPSSTDPGYFTLHAQGTNNIFYKICAELNSILYKSVCNSPNDLFRLVDGRNGSTLLFSKAQNKFMDKTFVGWTTDKSNARNLVMM